MPRSTGSRRTAPSASAEAVRPRLSPQVRRHLAGKLRIGLLELRQHAAAQQGQGRRVRIGCRRHDILMVEGEAGRGLHLGQRVARMDALQPEAALALVEGEEG